MSTDIVRGHMTIPNIFTLLRIFLIPVFVIVFYLDIPLHQWVCAAIFAFAALTDWIDGYLARKLKQTSKFGEFFDPVADKLIVAMALVLLVSVHNTPWFAIPAVIIVSREILVSALREWMAEIGLRANVKVSYIGKIKTACQLIAIVMLLLFMNRSAIEVVVQFGYFLLYIAAVLTLWSMLIYLKAAWPMLKMTADK